MIESRLSLVFLCALAAAGCSKQEAAKPAASPPPAGKFQVEEATIASIHAAIQSGQTTCKGVVQAYIDRARAYNGVCTALVTADGADIAPATGYVRAGAPLMFPTQDRQGLDDLSGSRSVPGPAARLRPHGADGLRPERRGSRWACASASPTPDN